MTCFKTRASRGNHGKLSQSPRGNMHKLFDCIRTPLERFLACLTFHKKEIRLRHLHKRTNTGPAPEFNSYFLDHFEKNKFKDIHKEKAPSNKQKQLPREVLRSVKKMFLEILQNLQENLSYMSQHWLLTEQIYMELLRF